MEAQAIFDTLKGKFGDAVVELQSEGFSPAFVVVAPAAVREIARFLKDDPALSFDSLMCLSGVDYKEKFAALGNATADTWTAGASPNTLGSA